MSFRTLLPVSVLGATFFLLPLLAHAAVPFFGPIIDPKVLDPTCALDWGAVMIVVNNIISFLITIAIVFVAPLMITYAGFLFVVNPVSEAGKTKAKHILLNTVVGIIIALCAWLIVDAIMAVLYDPGNGLGTWSSLVTSTGPTCIKLEGVFHPAPPVVTPVPVSPTATDELSIRQIFANAGVRINKDPCSSSQMAGPSCGTSPPPSCTNVAGMQTATIQQVVNIAAQLGCTVRDPASCPVEITGGTEPGHACGPTSHSAGFKVDLSQNYAALNTYLQTFKLTGARGGDSGGPIRTDTCGNEYVQESNHWDIKVKTACGGAAAAAPVSCPTDQSTKHETINDYSAVHKITLPSGGIVSIPLPYPAAGPQDHTEYFSAVGTPMLGYITGLNFQYSINHCPGVIENTGNSCYGSTGNADYTLALTVMTKPFPPYIGTAADAEVRGYCWAPESEGPWYLNFSWTMQTCTGANDAPLPECGFVFQRQGGPW